MYASFSRGMLGVAIEMGSDEGRDLFRRLAATSDVVIENFGAGVMTTWGCGYDDLRACNPELIMVSLSGYGRTGPRASYLAYGSNIANFTGIGDVWWTNPTYGDFLTAAHAAVAVLAARRHVADTGEGVLVDASQVEVVASMAASIYLDVLVDGEASGAPRRTGAAPARVLVHRRRPLGRGRGHHARGVERGVRRRRAARPPRRHAARARASSAPSCVARSTSGPQCARRCPLRTSSRSRASPAASVANTEEGYHDEQLHHRHFPTFVDHPDLGFMSSPGTPYRLSKTPGGIDRVGPRVGQHTREVLRRWVDLSDADVDALVAAGVAYDLTEH